MVSDERALATWLAGRDDEALASTLAARGVPVSAPWHDFFDAAEALLDAASVDRALARLPRAALAALVSDDPGAEAALAEQGPFAVAIVDLLLPDQRGDALLARLRACGVAEVGLLVTGTEPPANLLPEGAPDVLLRKPFELEELFESLAMALDPARGSRDSVAG